MAIFRGEGGAGDSNNDVTVSTVTQKATDAANSATASASSASTASTKASEASTSASTASTKASEASTSASNASTSASTASTQATNASNSATAAASSASTAAGHASDSALKANNLSDLASASTARGNLGLAIGTNVQAYDADLSAIAALDKTDSNFIVGNGSTWVLENASTARTSLGLGTAAVTATGAYATAAQGTKADNAAAKASNLSDLASASTARDNLGVEIGADVQAFDADLSAIAALDKTDSNFIVGNGSTWVAETGATVRTSLGLGTAATTAASAYATAAQGTTADNALAASAVSTFGGTLIDDANAGAARTTLGLGDVATTAASAYATSAQGTLATNALPKAGGAMTGAITTNSTFDGRDVATDGTKLDTIETNADVTDTANVTSAGALMDSEVTNLAQVKAFSTADYATAAQGTKVDNFLKATGSNVSMSSAAAGQLLIAGSGYSFGVALDASAAHLYHNSGARDLVLGINETEQVRVTSAGDLKFNSGFGSVGTAYGCRAWVNFNGTGTVAIRDSANVSSITDNGTGDYTVNFTNNMPDTNYCVNGTCLGGSTSGSNYIIFGGKNANTSNTQTVSAVQITLAYVASTSGNGGLLDHNVINASIFR